MMSLRLIAGVSVLLLLNAGVAQAQGGVMDRARRDEIVNVPADDPAMEAAFAKARATLDGFLALLAAPPANTSVYSVKIRVVDPANREVEYFWLSDLRRDGDRLSGRIDNTPRSVTNVRQGEVMRVTRGEIYDWMYRDDARRRMMGNFTLCAILSHEKPSEAAAVKRQFGLVCD